LLPNYLQGVPGLLVNHKGELEKWEKEQEYKEMFEKSKNKGRRLKKRTKS